MTTRLPLFAAAAFALLAATGCPKKGDQKPSFDPDANSGPDGKRPGAVPIEFNKVSPPDEVNYDKQDMTDWKMVELTGRPGTLAVTIRWESDKSDMNLDVFDAIGNQIANSPGPQPGTIDKKVAVPIEKMGSYYIRVQAPKTKDGSVYTLDVKWDGYVEEAPPPPPPPVEEPKKEPKKPKEPRVEKPKKAAGSMERIAETGLQGRIVSSYKDGGGMTLYIDKGSAAGVKAGQIGTILDGPNGATPLAGGQFKIDSVVDEHKSIGKTGLRSLGKNNRIAIDTGK
jgi:hypothetical protein